MASKLQIARTPQVDSRKGGRGRAAQQTGSAVDVAKERCWKSVPRMAVLRMAVLGMAVLGMAVLGMAVLGMAILRVAVLGIGHAVEDGHVG